MFISTLVAVKLHLCGVKHLHELLLTEHWRVGFLRNSNIARRVASKLACTQA